MRAFANLKYIQYISKNFFKIECCFFLYWVDNSIFVTMVDKE